LDYYHEKLNVDKFSDHERTSKTHTVDLDKDSLGYYIRDELNILEELILSVGYRAERAQIKGSEITIATATKDFDDKKIHKGEAYEAGLTWLIGEKSKVFAKYAQVYRYPFTDEQASYYGFVVGGDTFYADLEKEKGKSYEIGTQFYPLENLKIGLTFFRIDMQDEIVPNAFYVNENLDETRHEGAEFDISYALKGRARLYANVTYHNAEFRNGTNAGNTVPLVPETAANVGLAIYLPWQFELRPGMKYVGTSYQGGDNSNTAEKVGRYTMFDVLLFYRPEPTNGFKFSAFIGVENLTDERHALIYWSGYYPLPGVTVKGGISIGF
jgi:iron complex outermembrane receptor protein